MMRSKITIVLFLGILILGFLVRLYRFDNPVADWHSWRQVDTSSVSRVFAEEGFDLLHPKYHDLSNVPSGFDNPEGYRFVEFPIYNALQAGFYKSIGVINLEEWGRLLTIFASLLSTAFIFLLLRKYTEDKIALFGAFLFAVVPYNIYYGRVILPGPMMVASILGGIYFFDLFVDKLSDLNKRDNKDLFFVSAIFISATLFTLVAFLLKPFAIFFTLPMMAIAFNKYKFGMIKKWYLWFFAIITIFPLILWRIWIIDFPEGVPASNWLLNGGGIRFKGAFFYWIFEKRIGELIMTAWGSVLLLLGILVNSNSEKTFKYRKGQMLIFWAFLISTLSYLVVVARGNVQHDYYQILIMPTLVIFAALGTKLFFDPPFEIVKKYISVPLLLVITLFLVAFGWYSIRDYFNINRNSIIVAGEAVDRLTPKDALVIANYEGDTTFLYQTHRKGWASYTHDLDEMIKMGAQFLVIADPTESDMQFGEKYKILDQSEEYIIFDLKNK